MESGDQGENLLGFLLLGPKKRGSGLPQKGSGVPFCFQGLEEEGGGCVKVSGLGAKSVESKELRFYNTLKGVGGVKTVVVEEGMGVRGFEKHLGVQTVVG